MCSRGRNPARGRNAAHRRASPELASSGRATLVAVIDTQRRRRHVSAAPRQPWKSGRRIELAGVARVYSIWAMNNRRIPTLKSIRGSGMKLAPAGWRWI